MVTYFYTFFIKQYTKIQKIDENPGKINTGISGSPGVGGVCENSNSSRKTSKMKNRSQKGKIKKMKN